MHGFMAKLKYHFNFLSLFQEKNFFIYIWIFYQWTDTEQPENGTKGVFTSFYIRTVGLRTNVLYGMGHNLDTDFSFWGRILASCKIKSGINSLESTSFIPYETVYCSYHSYKSPDPYFLPPPDLTSLLFYDVLCHTII